MESKIYNQKAMDDNHSNTMIDYEKFCKTDNSGYTVHFANKNKLSVNKIEEIFSAYGKVLTVNTSGSDYGFRFVKYGTLDEAKCCIENLRNSDIQLLPEKTKMNNSNNRLNKNNSSQWQAGRTENSYKTSSIGKQFNWNSAHNEKFSEVESVTHNMKTCNGHSQFDNTDNFSDTGSKSSIRSFKSTESNNFQHKVRPVDNSSGIQNPINNSSNRMDYGKYYKIGKDGTYIVHFVNKKELSPGEIQKIFSPYGNILSVHSTGERFNGLVFIRYKSLQETIKCLKGLENNDVICILPQKDKMNGAIKKTDQKSSNHRQSAGIQDSFQGTSKGLNSNLNYDEKFSKAEEKLIRNTTSEWDRVDNNCKVFNFEEQQQKSKSHSFTKSDINTYMNTCISNDKIPALTSDPEFDAISDSSSQSESKNASRNIISTRMQEIIVANIHANYDVHYILHLFKKYNPISATLAKTILETNLRYCRVYFKTIQDAITIEEEFDNFNLSGKNLIVLRISRLMEEATCK